MQEKSSLICVSQSDFLWEIQQVAALISQVSELSTQLLTLLIALIGLGILMSLLFWGARGPSKLLGCLFSPFRWLASIVFGLLVLAIVLVIATQKLPELTELLGRFGISPTGSGRGNPPGPPVPASVVLLDRYPMLTQRDVSIYASAAFAESMDGAVPVKKQACLATSYLMLVRAHGNRSATIGPDQPDVGGGVRYSIGIGAVQPPGFAFDRRGYDPEVVIDEITRSAHPVILRTEYVQGQNVLLHFVLAVGYDRATREILYNDPWFDDNAGSRPRFPGSGAKPALQRLANYKVTQMFVVTKLPNP